MRKKIIFYGRIQGVGFRYTVKMLAEKYNIFGWAENNEDESVTLVAEGEENNIESLINDLQDYFPGKIKNIKETIQKDDGLIDFEIK